MDFGELYLFIFFLIPSVYNFHILIEAEFLTDIRNRGYKGNYGIFLFSLFFGVSVDKLSFQEVGNQCIYDKICSLD